MELSRKTRILLRCSGSVSLCGHKVAFESLWQHIDVIIAPGALPAVKALETYILTISDVSMILRYCLVNDCIDAHNYETKNLL